MALARAVPPPGEFDSFVAKSATNLKVGDHVFVGESDTPNVHIPPEPGMAEHDIVRIVTITYEGAEADISYVDVHGESHSINVPATDVFYTYVPCKLLKASEITAGHFFVDQIEGNDHINWFLCVAVQLQVNEIGQTRRLLTFKHIWSDAKTMHMSVPQSAQFTVATRPEDDLPTHCPAMYVPVVQRYLQSVQGCDNQHS